MNIKYLPGDATSPSVHPALIAHVVNDRGIWGRGFAAALSDRYPTAKVEYRRWANGFAALSIDCKRGVFKPGVVQYVPLDDVVIANMVAMRGVYGVGNPQPLDYSALQDCLISLEQYALDRRLTIHMPKIGSGLARGSWNRIYKLIVATIRRVPVYIYEYERSPDQIVSQLGFLPL